MTSFTSFVFGIYPTLILHLYNYSHLTNQHITFHYSLFIANSCNSSQVYNFPYYSLLDLPILPYTSQWSFSL